MSQVQCLVEILNKTDITFEGNKAWARRSQSAKSNCPPRQPSMPTKNASFLAVQNSSIGDLVPWSVCLSDRTNNQSLHKPKESSHTLVTFGTFDQSDEET